MLRDIETSLLEWKNHPSRKPLLLRGARQTGKTYVVEKFGKNNFQNFIAINFELEPDYIRCFDSLDPKEIIKNIALLKRQVIEPHNTLFFLDEIQECPNAIRALRYFKEKSPEIGIIGAGSLLEFVLNDAEFRMPVGRIQSLYLKPLSFKEYLSAKGYQELRKFLEQVTWKDSIAEPVHMQLLHLIKEYMIVGGMPEVIKEYLLYEDWIKCQDIQTQLLQTYRNDFGKYAPRTNHKYLQLLFEKAPGLIAETFKFVNVDPEVRSRDLKKALELLRDAGLIHVVYSTAASGLPLVSLINERKFKIIFLDIGLAMRTTGLQSELLFTDNVMLVNRGSLAEQFVGQEFVAYSPDNEESRLYYWTHEKITSQSEVDYVISIDGHIIPVEVKAGATGKLKSLRRFMDEKKINFGIRISQHPLSFHDKIVSVPLYLIGEVQRLVRSI